MCWYVKVLKYKEVFFLYLQKHVFKSTVSFSSPHLYVKFECSPCEHLGFLLLQFPLTGIHVRLLINSKLLLDVTISVNGCLSNSSVWHCDGLICPGWIASWTVTDVHQLHVKQRGKNLIKKINVWTMSLGISVCFEWLFINHTKCLFDFCKTIRVTVIFEFHKVI